jgi:hypothetical protein
METVEKKVQTEPMRIGFGPKEHHETLRAALGCVEVLTLDQLDGIMALDVSPFREDSDDVAVFVRPTYVTGAHIKWMAACGIRFEVAGHAPIRLRSFADREAFRALKPSVPGVDVPDGRGAKPLYAVSDEHLNAAIADWHSGEFVKGKWATDYTLKQIEERMRLRSGLEIRAHWVRDQVKKRFGSAARNPNTMEGQG